MAKNTIDASQLGAALREQLGLYHEEVVEELNAAGAAAVKKLVQLTKKTAPKSSGDFARSITSTEDVNNATGDKTYTWGAKAPQSRITHLLVHGHETVNGDRVDGDPFLENALETVLPEYEKAVEEALQK